VRELRKIQDTVRGELDMVLHPEHGTSSSDVPYQPDEPGDHTAIASGDVTSMEVTPDPPDEERRFHGPPDSFI
jgi:hypothetical protein